jgi:hypothetical protein
MIILMNHLRNTIKRYIDSDSVRITAMAIGSAGFCVGGIVGIVNGFNTAASNILYRRGPITARQRLGQSMYICAHIIGQPIVGAVAGTAIAITAPVSVPVLYYLYQKAEKEERREEREERIINKNNTY